MSREIYKEKNNPVYDSGVQIKILFYFWFLNMLHSRTKHRTLQVVTFFYLRCRLFKRNGKDL